MDINEVRGRAEELAIAMEALDAPQDAATIRAMLADHARLLDLVDGQPTKGEGE